MAYRDDDPIGFDLTDVAMFVAGVAGTALIVIGFSHVIDVLRAEWPAVCEGLTLAAECSARIVEGRGL